MINKVRKLVERLIVSFAIVAMCVACDQMREVEVINEFEVQAVYYHEQYRFSVLRNMNSIVNIVPIPSVREFCSRLLTIKVDVNPNEPIWYEENLQVTRFTGNCTGRAVLHIRNVDDINTAGWNHGKFGQGTTVRIQ